MEENKILVFEKKWVGELSCIYFNFILLSLLDLPSDHF